MDESSTPTALVKIFGDFESRVQTASRRTFEGHEGIRRHASGSALPSYSRASGMSTGLRGRLKFEESSILSESSPNSSSSRKRRILEDPLEGLDRYPKAVKSEDSRQMQAEIERLKMQLIQKDADIVSLEADVKKGEAVLKKMQVEVTKDKILRENERETLVRQSRIDQEKIADLQNKVQILVKRKEYQEDYEFQAPRRESQQHQNEVERLTEELIQLRDEIYETRTEFEDKEATFKNQIQDLQSKNDELEAQMQEIRPVSNENSSETRLELEQTKGKLEVAKQEIKKLQSEIEASNEDRIQYRIMKDKLDTFAQMQHNIENLKVENKLLNDTADNAQLLKEQNEDLKEKLQVTETSLLQSRQKQEELVFAERQLSQWRQLFYRLFTTQERSRMQDNLGPDALAAKISQLQQEILEKSENIEAQKSQLKEKDGKIEDLKSKLSENAKNSEQDKLNLTEQANLIKRFKRKLLLVTKERDSYKGVLESYEHELTFTGAAFEKDRIGALESTVKDYQETIEKLEELLQAARSTRQEAEIIQGLRSQIESLQSQLLEAQQNQGQAEQPEKILHFLNNPLSQAVDSRQAEFEELKNENQALKARVQLLEEGQTKDLTLLVGQKMDEGTSSEEVKELKEQLKAAEIRKQRLIEAFKKTSQDFREVSYRLTGFRIDGLSDGKYRLSPVYAESPDEYLLFKREESGECMLLETEYSSLEHVQKLIRLHLQQQNSIPVFLAAVITDMFSRQTFDTMDDDDDEDNEEEPQEVQEEEVIEEEEEAGEEEDENAESEDIEEESVHDEEELEQSGEEQDDDDDDDDIVCID